MYEQPVLETLGEGKFLRLVRAGRWEYAQRATPDAVILLAVTPGDKLLFVEQHRPPVHSRVIEFPAGLVGDEAEHAGEPLEEAARRELIEETGYDAARITRLFTGCASAGMTDEIATFFLAEGLTRVAAGGGVEGEDLILHEVDLARADSWLEEQMQRGLLIDGRVYSGLYWVRRLRGQIAGLGQGPKEKAQDVKPRA